ncbi:MAG: FHA domain-containing protein [Bdellovibrionales bacterium]|nr:FHA domain-containing protein [Bdellovibrionales bacterium]
MSTDSTELTFVRCPSCRSLVPAVSTRCRMCGASLDTEADMQGEETPAQDEASGRVRQRTMSQGKSNLTSTAEQIREEMEEIDDSLEEEDLEDDLEMDSDYDDGPLDDPLSGYIEEVDESPEPSHRATSEAQEEPAEVLKPTRNGTAEKPQEQTKPAVRIESGTKRGGLSFNKKEVAPPKEVAFESQVEPEYEEVEEEVVEEIVEQRAEPIRQAPQPRQEPRREQRDSHVREPEKASKPSQGVTPAKGPQQGRLFGWLVSYANPEGEAIELREGRFFVTASSLKQSDMVIEEESISTPHALVTISERGFEVQDLMSERGVHVRGREEDTYQREEEVVTVEHGDWLRFGDVEFLVTLIAHVGKP